MEEELKTLAKMQALDDQIGRYRILQKELPKQLNEIIESVEEATANLLAVETERAEINKKQRSVEMDIKQMQEQSKKYSAQLTEIKNNKEYKALNSEIAYIKDKISDNESSLLELMELENEIKEKIATAKSVLEKAEALKKEKESDLREQIASLDTKIEEVRTQRNDLARTLPVSLVKYYGNMIKHKQNQAVAYTREGSCGACGFVIRQQMRIELQLRRKIIYCENCGRILMNRFEDKTDDASS
ncbi:MAG TPA: C4-type zinc ribbon domain-containing protein [Candidatus Cloacimonas sp.]|jgi:predicted  nucleic acid-binding Zn-ribbon protein|nr:C4-type zinc ribbon domain-containing protein [Candidatus Cloacimonas sp.]